MILFYNKDNGNIFATIDGRVHTDQQLNCYISDKPENNDKIGKYIIGWIERDNQKIDCNLDKFDILQRFEDITPESPLDYKIDIETNNLIKK